MGIPNTRLRLVLHQVQGPDNLGSVARAMANFGYQTLTLSDPVTTEFQDAHRMAVHAGDILSSMTVVRTLDEAIGPAVVALGTSSRESIKGREVLTPEEGLRRLEAASELGPVALVLGGEKRGLSDGELDRCQLIVRIPTSEAQPSMNLSHAAALLLYLAAHGERSAAGVPSEPTPTPTPTTASMSTPSAAPAARLEAVHALEARMKGVLLRADFLNAQAPEHVLGELMRSLTRGQLTQREVELWLSAFAHLGRL